MEKITQKMIREYKKHAREVWHDAAWWEVEKTADATMIQSAMHTLGEDATVKEIAKEANEQRKSIHVFLNSFIEEGVK